MKSLHIDKIFLPTQMESKDTKRNPEIQRRYIHTRLNEYGCQNENENARKLKRKYEMTSIDMTSTIKENLKQKIH